MELEDVLHLAYQKKEWEKPTVANQATRAQTLLRTAYRKAADRFYCTLIVRHIPNNRTLRKPHCGTPYFVGAVPKLFVEAK